MFLDNMVSLNILYKETILFLDNILFVGREAGLQLKWDSWCFFQKKKSVKLTKAHYGKLLKVPISN